MSILSYRLQSCVLYVSRTRSLRPVLYFMGKYKIKDGPPIYSSRRSHVVYATELDLTKSYGELFEQADIDGSGHLGYDELKR